MGFGRTAARILVLLAVMPSLAVAETPAASVPQPSSAALRLIGDAAVSFDRQGRSLPTVAVNDALGTSVFTIGLSLRADEPAESDLGDLISLWDPATRHGFSLGLRNNTGCTSSQPNWRQLQFGIDAGSEPSWRDEGRPGAALLGFALCVHDGSLFVGTCEPNKDQAGRVFRYAGPGRWEDLGSPDGSNSVTTLASFRGQLYAGTGKYRLAGSALPESENTTLGGKVFRFVKSQEWELVGDLNPTEAIASLVTFRGRLYASSLYRPAGFFRYERDGEWTSLSTPNEKRVEALAIHDGSIFAGSYDGGAVYRFNGTQWSDLGLVGKDNTQTYSFATYLSRLHVGTWPSGRVFRLDPENRWNDTGRLGEELEVMGMLVHNGILYAGTLPRAEVYRYDGDERWTLLKQLVETPDVKYRRVWTMASYRGRLFCTTLPSGRIWSLSAGGCVTDDRELGTGWHQIVAQRAGNRLRLFVDGQIAAESDVLPSNLSLQTKGLSLTVGDGPRGRFSGQLKNVWFELGRSN